MQETGVTNSWSKAKDYDIRNVSFFLDLEFLLTTTFPNVELIKAMPCSMPPNFLCTCEVDLFGEAKLLLHRHLLWGYF